MFRYLLSFLLLSALLSACKDESDEDDYFGPTGPQLARVGESRSAAEVEPFDVYTRNAYLGGDTGPLFTLDFANIPAVVAATNVFWNQVQASAVEDRMAAIVDEIDRRRPHVVGLQEVLRFVVIEGTTPTGGIDLLALIEAEIAARGLPYTTEVVQATTSAGLPLAVGATGITRALSFTDRLVILRRDDVAFESDASGIYAVAVPLGPVTLRRGWARVSVDHHGTMHHFVTTHLEVQALAPVQAAQRQQLLDEVLAGLEGVTILAGDLNSDAAAEPGDVSWTDTYDVVRAAGFGDLWELAPYAARRAGYTCCQDPSLVSPSELDQRIDFVLVRADAGLLPDAKAQGLYRVEVVGDEEVDRTPGGLWASDHAGLIGSVRVVPAANAQ